MGELADALNELAGRPRRQMLSETDQNILAGRKSAMPFVDSKKKASPVRGHHAEE